MNYWSAIRRTSLSLCAALALSSASQGTRPFTAIDAIRTAHFGDPYWGTTDPLLFSPDGRYLLADVERGLPETNRPESRFRVYQLEDIRRFLERPSNKMQAKPYFEVSRSTFGQGPIITQIRWLKNSAGIVFLVKGPSGYDQLFLADVRTKRVSGLTLPNQDVVDFDVRDQEHYVYSVKSPAIRMAASQRSKVVGFVGTGHPLRDLIFPIDKYPWLLLDSRKINYDLKELWAVVGGRRFRVDDKSSKRPILLHWIGGFPALALSPDGHAVVTVMAMDFVPPTWRTEYPPPFANNPDISPPGPQDRETVNGVLLGSEYVQIDLGRGTIAPLTDAPTGYSEGWRSNESADWSSDGKWVVLSNSFIAQVAPNRAEPLNSPCVTVVAVETKSASCAMPLRVSEAQDQASWRFIENVRFSGGSGSRIEVNYYSRHEPAGMKTFVRHDNGQWVPADPMTTEFNRRTPITVSVAQGLNDPPVLMATDNRNSVSRVIWDPNPQLNEVDLGRASVFSWKDGSGRSWTGGLYLPAGYKQGERYPLVVQTHGFEEHEFRPEGIYPTAFAARALASAGLMVLQVPDCAIRFTSEEGACQVAGYESGIQELVSMGKVAPDRVGIIGFSRTCYAVLETLTRSHLHFAAASITDGLNMGYLQYLQYLDEANGFYSRDAEVLNQAKPFGDGLLRWFAYSPEFNMQKVTAPVQVVAMGSDSVLEMWEPYATLRFLHRPVDFIILGDGTHNLSNPEQRLACQQGTVDWFRLLASGV